MLSIDYIAGFIDGEGCFSITFNKKSDTYHGAIGVFNTDEAVITAMYIALANQGVFGAVHKRKQRKKGIKPLYALYVKTTSSTCKLCELLQGKLIVKAKHLRVMAQFIELKMDRENWKRTENEIESARACYYSMQVLNKKGL